jgi:hypothetical protein
MIRALCFAAAAMALFTSGLATAAPSEADIAQPQNAAPPKGAGTATGRGARRITNIRANANGITPGSPLPATAKTAPKVDHSDFQIQKHVDVSSPTLSPARRPADHHPEATPQPGGAAQSDPQASPPH